MTQFETTQFNAELEKQQKIISDRKVAVGFLSSLSGEHAVEELINLAKADNEILFRVSEYLDAFFGIPVDEINDYGLNEESFESCWDILERLDLAFGFTMPKNPQQLLQPKE